MYKHQQQFGLDIQFSALVLNFNYIFSNGHLYRAGQSMNSLPSQILERCVPLYGKALNLTKVMCKKLLILYTLCLPNMVTRLFSQERKPVHNACLIISANVEKLEANGYSIKSLYLQNSEVTTTTLTKLDLIAFDQLDTVYIQGIAISDKGNTYDNENLEITNYQINENTKQKSGYSILKNKSLIKNTKVSTTKYFTTWDSYFIVPKDNFSNRAFSINYDVSLNISPIISNITVESEEEKRLRKERVTALIIYTRKK